VALRNWQNIRALATLGPVDVLSIGEEAFAEQVEGVREWIPIYLPRLSESLSIVERMKTKLWLLRPGVHPLFDSNRHGSVVQWIQHEAGKRCYDVVVIEELSLAGYWEDLKRAGRQVVFDAHNVESVLREEIELVRSGGWFSFWTKFRAGVIRRRIAEAEQRVVAGADQVWVCSDHDAREIRRLYASHAPITVVPNGVDVEAYRRETTPPLDTNWSHKPITIIYPGSFSYVPNEIAALRLIHDVLPMLDSQNCDVRVVLAGRAPTSDILEAARRDSRIQVTGAIESVLPYLDQPCVVALPITLGSGSRLKILEAFAVGRSVVSTAKGAEGLDAVDGRDLLIRESPEAIAQGVIQLWYQPDLRTTLCTNALRLVRSCYSWSATAGRIRESLAGLQRNPAEGGDLT
jgi:glycosyltransferase involved in cell wall biosynthesis